MWIKGHDVQFDSDFLLNKGGVGRDLFKVVWIKGHDVRFLLRFFLDSGWGKKGLVLRGGD